MPVNSTHPDYDANLVAWSRARDVIAGEDVVKAAGERYLPRLDSQTDDEYAAYTRRASFFNATSRTAEGFVSLIFRRPPFIKTPPDKSALGAALASKPSTANTPRAFRKCSLLATAAVARAWWCGPSTKAGELPVSVIGF